jgi:hypothetical protein
VRISVDQLDDDMTDGPEFVKGVLARSAAELADLADRTERLQDVMADLVRQCAALGGDATQDMQALDWIAQHLEGLASFLDALSKQAPPGWRMDTTGALDALNLAELAHRLRGGGAPASVAQIMSSGDMELF